MSALIAAGASARAVTDPTALEPNGKTPASIADASGHKGLAGYLSEIALKHHLSSLTLQESEISKGSVELEPEIAVERLAAANRWLHESATTWDQTSLQLSLAAARGASQAAARIQAAFRASSFRRKRETADQQALEECFSAPADIFEYPLAATFIQKKFRGWVKRRRFLKLRKHAQRIQVLNFPKIEGYLGLSLFFVGTGLRERLSSEEKVQGNDRDGGSVREGRAPVAQEGERTPRI